MPWRVICPECQSAARTRETAAFVMTCPRCGHRFDVEAADPYDTPWGAFARGCRLVTVGLLVEVATLTALLLLWVGHFHWSAADRRRAVWGYDAYLTPLQVLGLLAFGLVIGSLLIGLGRTALTAVPRASGIVGPLRGAAIVSWLQFVLTFAGILLVIDQLFGGAYWESRWSSPLAAGFLVGSVGLRFFAELTAAAAIGMVGGVMPSRQLRARVSRFTVASQAVGVGLALLAVLLVVVVMIPNTARRKPDGWVLGYGWAAIFAVGFAVLLASALANLSLYTSARRAALEWKPPPELPK